MNVVNKRAHVPTPKDIYIGRPSPLGNPFTHKPGTLAQTVVGSRAEAIAKYDTWLRERVAAGDPAVLKALDAISHDANLVCWCKPAACHGDVIVKMLAEFRQSDMATAQLQSIRFGAFSEDLCNRIRKDHQTGCAFRASVLSVAAFYCKDHELAVCPTCDPCTCAKVTT